MTDPQQTPDGMPPMPPSPLERRLLGRRRLAIAALLFERLWPAIWPALGLFGVFLCVALLDLLPLLPAWAHAAMLGLVGIGVVALLARGLRRIRRPSANEADRRLEHSSGLRHRPLAVFTDRPALPGAELLWQAHVDRALAQIGCLRVGLPRPGLAARDPRALRAAVVVGLFACLVIAGADAPLRLVRAVTPGFAPPVPPPATELQAWITPPGYTGMAPVFLNTDTHEVSVPAGSHLTVSLTGGSGVPSLSLNGQQTPFQTLGEASFQADRDLAAGGRLLVRRQGHELGAWALTVVADRAPEVSFPTPPSATRARLPQTRLPWQVSHDYGVVALQAELRLRDRPADPPLVVPIPLPGGAPKSAKGVRQQDLTANPWAGLPVIARLAARDAPGLTGTSAPAEFVLPERVFQNPVARALMAIRKQLTLKPDDRLTAMEALDGLASLDDVWQNDLGGFLNLRAIDAMLYRDRDARAIAEAQSRMWQLALHLEEGATDRTARALAQAREALRETLDAQQRGEKIDPAELDRRMKDVQQALDQHLQALAEQAQRDPSSEQFDPERHRLDAQDMEKLAQEMRDAARDGRMDDARQKMAELDKMLEELQNARPEHGQMTERERQRAQQRQRGQQQMTVLQDLVRRQGGLLDHAQERAIVPNELPRRGLQPPADPQAADRNQAATATARKSEQSVQSALRMALGELMQQYGDLTGQVPPNLGDADGAMRDAGQALAQGADGAAAGAEQRAIEALQKGGQSMSQQMARQFGRGQQQGDGEQDADEGDQDGDQDGQGQMAGNQDGTQPGGNQRGPGRGDRPWANGRSADRRADERRDPLGRPLHQGNSGTDESSDVQVPDQMEEARTREIQDELRKRGADRTRPQPELDYIGRLLQQF